MKRIDLIKTIEGFGCELVRHGGKHDCIAIRQPERCSPFRAIENSKRGWLVTSYANLPIHYLAIRKE